MERGDRVRTAGKQIAMALPGANLVRLAAESVAGEFAGGAASDWRAAAAGHEEMQSLSPRTASSQAVEAQAHAPTGGVAPVAATTAAVSAAEPHLRSVGSGSTQI